MPTRDLPSDAVLRAALVVATVLAACAGERVDPYTNVDAGNLATDSGGRTDARATRDVLADTGTVIEPDVPTVGPTVDAGVVCHGNNDGIITRDESPVVLGATVTYAVNSDNTVVTVNTAGVPMDGGSGRLWDFTQPTTQDERVLDQVVPPTGEWWASQYPTAGFAAILDRPTDTYGVYVATQSATSLLAAVSHNADLTDLAMSPSVDVLRYPLSLGLTWTANSTGTGYDNDAPLTNTSQYTFTVDAQGEVWTTAGRFQVLRVRTDLTQSVPLTVFSSTTRSYAYVAECWGVVAHIVSQSNETSVEFTSASVYQRLSL